MAIKPTLYWTLVRGWHLGGLKIMRVTTEKATMLCGTIGDSGTSVSRSKTVGQFKTELEAQNRIDEVMATLKRFRPLIDQARANLRAVEDRERDVVEKALTRGPGLGRLERMD